MIPPAPGPARELVRISAPADFGNISGGSLGAMPWSPNGKSLLFPRDGALWRVDIDTNEVVRLTDPGMKAMEATWSPDGKQIAIQSLQAERSGLWLLPAGGGEPSLLLVDEHDNRDPAWSADSRRIVFVRSRGGDYVGNFWDIEMDSRRLRQVNVGSVNDLDPVVARDGRVAFVQWREGADLYVARMDDGSHRQVTSHRGGSYYARFSPDGKRMVYSSTQSGPFEVWLHELATRAERRLDAGSFADWSPDGRKVVCVSTRGDGSARLWLLDLHGGSPRPLLDQTVSQATPRWARDGRAISFYAANEVWAVDPDGGNPRRPLSGAKKGGISVANDFDWYGDSRHAVFTRYTKDGSGEREMVIRDLDMGLEAVLFRGAHGEPVVSPDGLAVAFCRGPHLRQDLWVLRLRLPDSPEGLPEPIGEPQQLTDGKGAWHVHNGGWSPDGKEIVYSRALPESEILVIENYR